MKIIGKSRVEKEQLRSKKGICKYLEIQLFDDFVNGKTVESLFNEIKAIDGIDVINLHSPILFDDDVNLEYIENDFYYEQLEKTFELADLLSKHYNHDIKVIIHSSLNIEQYDKFPFLYNKIITFFKCVLTIYPNVNICIENVVPFIIRKGKIIAKNSFLFDNVQLVKKLREDLNTNRIFTVLDTCHLLLTLRVLNAVFGESYSEYIENIDIESYFKENADVIGLIHLADVKDLGFHKMEHGIMFEPERFINMYEFIDLYIKEKMTCNITIEIQEDNYVKANKFRENYKNLVKYLDYKGISYES